MINKCIKYLTSLRFTVLVIGLLGVVFALGLWIPQKHLLQGLYFDWQAKYPALVALLDALQLTDIYTAPVTLSLWVFFFLNLSLVLWQRIPLISRRIAVTKAKITDPASSPGYPFRDSYLLKAGGGDAELFSRLGDNGYQVLGDAGGFYAIKNRYSPIAFALFHLSFFLILLGGVVSVYTEFIGYVDLAQGEKFEGGLASYNRSPRPALPKIGGIPRAVFTISAVAPRVVGNTPTGITVTLVDGDGRTHEVGINTPYLVDHTSFVFKHLGIAPLFVLVDPSGKDLEGAYLKLDVLQGRQDHFSLGGYLFTAHFYPDYLPVKGVRTSKTAEFNNPVFFLRAERDGKKVAEGVVPRNGTLAFNGYRLEMRDMPYWVRFYVIKQRGLSILYAGFALASLAVIWRLVFFRRELVGAVREGEGGRHLVVAARAEYYTCLAEEEFRKLFEKVTAHRRTDR